MKAMAQGFLGTILSLVLLSAAGCASQAGSSTRNDASRYDTMSCADLNVAMGDAAKGISTTAISRGKVAHWNVPVWAPGGAKAVGLIEERQSARIERLRQQQAAIDAARRRQCR
ncbi:hypothetical protein [Hoeflea sp. 108]|uniref:hypothetical protein n=1 Tax=Hoeflea sp. 108 TaxID=1116369 RepID=UPI000373B535|nr:hypothetical protein [Hoeflea sp. 108]